MLGELEGVCVSQSRDALTGCEAKNVMKMWEQCSVCQVAPVWAPFFEPLA